MVKYVCDWGPCSKEFMTPLRIELRGYAHPRKGHILLPDTQSVAMFCCTDCFDAWIIQRLKIHES